MSQTPHILICDDDPIVHESLSLYLDSEHYSHSDALGTSSTRRPRPYGPSTFCLGTVAERPREPPGLRGSLLSVTSPVPSAVRLSPRRRGRFVFTPGTRFASSRPTSFSPLWVT